MAQVDVNIIHKQNLTAFFSEVKNNLEHLILAGFVADILTKESDRIMIRICIHKVYEFFATSGRSKIELLPSAAAVSQAIDLCMYNKPRTCRIGWKTQHCNEVSTDAIRSVAGVDLLNFNGSK